MIQKHLVQNEHKCVLATARPNDPEAPCRDKTDEILEILCCYLDRPTEVLRNQLFTALRLRLQTVVAAAARGYRMNSADVDDVIQEALLRFAKQERKGRGIFSRTTADSLCPRRINANIKGNVCQRSADWYRVQERSARIVAQSLDAVMEGSVDVLSVIESSAAQRSAADRELCTGVNEVVSAFVKDETTPLIREAIEDAMTRGDINTTQLASEHGRSQPTVWREVARAKMKLRSRLESEGFGPR